MENLEKFIESIGVFGEMAALFYKSLTNAGLEETTATTLTVKLIGEILRIAANESEESTDE